MPPCSRSTFNKEDAKFEFIRHYGFQIIWQPRSADASVDTGMNHGQLLIDRPEEVARRIIEALSYNNSSKSFFWIVHVAKFGERPLFGVVGSRGHNVVKNF